MERNTINIIIIIVAIIFILAFVGLGVYYIISLDFNSTKSVAETNNQDQNNSDYKIPKKEEVEAQNKINYPDTLIGIINFLDENKSTLKTTDNKEYIFYPDQPVGIYQSFGVKDGDKVQVQAKILEDSKIKWTSIKKISE